MLSAASTIQKLQKEVDKRESGVLLRVQLLNRDELNILLDDITFVIDKFSAIITKACAKVDNFHIFGTKDPTLFFILMPDDEKAAERLAYSVYSQIQLYVDKKFPESYFKSCVSSIRFGNKRSIPVEKMVSLMVYGMTSSGDRSYYYNYEDHQLDIEKLRADNVNLSLLRSSLLQNQAKFVYQPIIERKSGKVEYYECLLRVKDKAGDFISVGPMIKDAENKGLIHIVDWTVMKMAVNELENDPELKLSVNISNIGVLNKRLLKKIENLLKKSDVAHRLIIEITETSLNLDFVNTKKFIDVLHKYGCRFALDDFGSGFTSFKQLLNLPVDIIKIDGSYIRDILSDDHSKLFVQSLIKLADELGIKTVAEFVESGEVAKFLIDLKVTGMQGNFFYPASDKKAAG